MVMSNADRISSALNLLRDGLKPNCEQTWRGYYGTDWLENINKRLRNPQREPTTDDIAFIIAGIKLTWNEIFSHGFPLAVRSLVFEVSETRNKWAHQVQLSTDDTLRALDSMERLLEAFGNKTERRQVQKSRRSLERQRVEQEASSERHRVAKRPTEGQAHSGLTPWREIITPHEDVSSGRFEQAEFAADLYDVLVGEAEPEYQDPKEFFAPHLPNRGFERNAHWSSTPSRRARWRSNYRTSNELRWRQDPFNDSSLPSCFRCRRSKPKRVLASCCRRQT